NFACHFCPHSLHHGISRRSYPPRSGHDYGPGRCREGALMSDLLTRRRLITTCLAAAAGASGLAVDARLADRYGLIPPDHRGLFGAGETLTYAAHRILTAHHSLAREFERSQISKVIPVNGKHPEVESYQRLQAGGFADWRLTIDGLVARPSSFS